MVLGLNLRPVERLIAGTDPGVPTLLSWHLLNCKEDSLDQALEMARLPQLPLPASGASSDNIASMSPEVMKTPVYPD